MDDELLKICKDALKEAIGNSIESFEITLLDFCPKSNKFTVAIEVKVGEKTYILHSCKKTLQQVTDDIVGKYNGIAFCYSQGSLRKAREMIERYFMQ